MDSSDRNLDVKVFQIVSPIVGGLAQIAVEISLWRSGRSSRFGLAGENVGINRVIPVIRLAILT